MSDEALEILARGTRGVPRLLNRAMHQAMILVFRAEAVLVDAEAAMDALGILGLADEGDAEADGPSIASPTEQGEEDRGASEREVGSEPVLSLEETTERIQERASFSLQDSSGTRRSSASPRRPA